MKRILTLLLFSLIALGAGTSSLKAVERLASGLCTHFKPKFFKKPILDDAGETIGEKLVIDIGDGQEIAAGEDWDSSSLASTDDRITFDYDIKTRRLYRCNQINDPADKGGLAEECRRRGFDHGMITNGSEKCFTSW